MNNKHYIWTAGMLLSLAVAGLSSCTDDHFDINPDVAGRETIWQNIKTRADLSEYADVLSRVHYSKLEGSPTTQTYADLLDHAPSFTVWAPKNGTFDYAKWKALLDEGTVEGAYKVENELIRNNMTRFNHVLNGAATETLDMYNGKMAEFDCGEATLKGIHISTPNIETSNGVLHILDGAVPYVPNVYEYIKATEGLDSLRSFLTKYEEREFDEKKSTQGPTIDGNITWVDSVVNINNRYFPYLGAMLTAEDSSFVMVMPTNAAWEKTYKAYKSYFKFQPEYVQSIVTVGADGSENTEKRTTTFTAEEVDSLSTFYTRHVITGFLAFNANQQHGAKVEDYGKPGACDSLVNTKGMAILAPYCAQLFDGKQPVALSNGYAFVVDNYNVRPEDTFLEPVVYEAENNCLSSSYCTPKYQKLSQKAQNRYEQPDGSVVLEDTLIEPTVLITSPERATANTSVTFRLRNTYSCKYDIYAVMTYNHEAQRPYQFRATLNYHKGRVSSRENLTAIEGVNGSGRNFVTQIPHYDDNGKVQYNDSVLIARDFELPVCYCDISDAYVTLELSAYIPSSQRNTYTNEMYIDKIVLVPKRNAEE